ncbi:hypothetical protein [Piscinibacter sp.]|jgi:hypothetical protein|uniref:hypothetical protein n=1 Tax=Piscinibacter sp. TaxID=1903157 RepID=UPI002F42DB4C
MHDHFIALRLGRRFVHLLIASALVLAMLATWALSALAASDSALSRTVDGMTVYLGVTPSAVAFERAGSRPESLAHGTKRPGKASQHLMVALVDAKSGSRIADAKVTANVTELGLGNEEKRLELMTVGGTPSYGNHFTLKPGNRYTITVKVWRAGARTPTEASFDYSRP